MIQKKDSSKETNRLSSEGGRLTIDCTKCDGPSSVTSRDCLICMCDAVKEQSEIDSVMLHSCIDTSFQGDSLTLIRELASVFSVLTMNPSERRGQRCRKCRNSYARIVSDQIPLFPDIDIPLLNARIMQTKVRDEVCEICLGDTSRLLDHLQGLLDDVRSAVIREGE